MFRRKKAGAEVEPDDAEDASADPDPDAYLGADPRAAGPWDVSEVDLQDDDQSRVDLGSLLITPHDDVEVQLQVEEATGQVAAVILAAEQGAAELRAFAAPRNGDIWDQLRRSVTDEVVALGGTATEQDGVFGSELVVTLTVELPDGQHAEQRSKVIGISGPRWLLRATLFGRPAVDPLEDGDIERAVREVVVVRGQTPLPPGDPLPLRLPPHAQPAGTPTGQ